MARISQSDCTIVVVVISHWCILNATPPPTPPAFVSPSQHTERHCWAVAEQSSQKRRPIPLICHQLQCSQSVVVRAEKDGRLLLCSCSSQSEEERLLHSAKIMYIISARDLELRIESIDTHSATSVVDRELEDSTMQCTSRVQGKSSKVQTLSHRR